MGSSGRSTAETDGSLFVEAARDFLSRLGERLGDDLVLIPFWQSSCGSRRLPSPPIPLPSKRGDLTIR